MSKSKAQKAKQRREWRTAARVLGISYEHAQMARILGWSLDRLYTWKGRAGKTLANRLEKEYRPIYGEADPYSNPKTLKDRRQEKHEKNAQKKRQTREKVN